MGNKPRWAGLIGSVPDWTVGTVFTRSFGRFQKITPEENVRPPREVTADGAFQRCYPRLDGGKYVVVDIIERPDGRFLVWEEILDTRNSAKAGGKPG